MSVMKKDALNAAISAIRKNSTEFREAVHEALISCAYYATKDSNVTPFNDLLEAVGDGTRKKGITTWAEVFAPVFIKDERFQYSKKAGTGFAVLNEDDFAQYEKEMRDGPKWFEIVRAEKVESIWDAGEYLERVVKNLQKHGADSKLVEMVRNAEIAARVMATKVEELKIAPANADEVEVAA